MKQRPILFSAPMVNAILDDSKTMTRRALKNPYVDGDWSIKPALKPRFDGHTHDWYLGDAINSASAIKCPYGQVGDQLWVRETWMYKGCMWGSENPDVREYYVKYCADEARKTYVLSEDIDPSPKQRRRKEEEDEYEYKRYLDRFFEVKRPSIFMPKPFSRILLEITNVRVERLNDISEEDAIAEGSFLNKCNCLPPPKDNSPINLTFKQTWCNDHGYEFKALWESINGAGSWAANPWVWVVEFKKVK